SRLPGVTVQPARIKTRRGDSKRKSADHVERQLETFARACGPARQAGPTGRRAPARNFGGTRGSPHVGNDVQLSGRGAARNGSEVSRGRSLSPRIVAVRDAGDRRHSLSENRTDKDDLVRRARHSPGRLAAAGRLPARPGWFGKDRT